jgi:hypothetical protein
MIKILHHHLSAIKKLPLHRMPLEPLKTRRLKFEWAALPTRPAKLTATFGLIKV